MLLILNQVELVEGFGIGNSLQKKLEKKGQMIFAMVAWHKNHLCQASISLLLGQEGFHELLYSGLEENDKKDEEGTAEKEDYKGNKLIVLVENGSTHNFVKQEVASRLKLPFITIKSFKVQVGSGAFLTWSDIVLGVQWLAELDDIMINHKDLTMSFQGDSGVRKLYGEKFLVTEPINGKAVRRLAEANSIACMYSMQTITGDKEQKHNDDILTKIKALLTEFSGGVC
ncbi:RVP_2 domain-containing protein [Senna tora]|uniref:RVP_2 domain-containing protein n=1 Tax=Senna tora TaxID=362788 RepID=A0A834TKS5_9FABA|nr:RVP_2 domain-containing protein [Senna tora]